MPLAVHTLTFGLFDTSGKAAPAREWIVRPAPPRRGFRPKGQSVADPIWADLRAAHIGITVHGGLSALKLVYSLWLQITRQPSRLWSPRDGAPLPTRCDTSGVHAPKSSVS